MTIMLRKRIRKLMLLLSLLLFPVTVFYLSPLTPYFGAFFGKVTGSLAVFAILFILSLFTGRVFCGWICPAGACQEAAFPVNERRVPVKKIRWLKFAIWIPWLFGLVFFLLQAGGSLTFDFFFGTEEGISAADAVTYVIYFSVLLVFLTLAVIAGRRAACHTICWMAPFMILGRQLGALLHLPGVRLRANKSACVSCESCSQACPMSLPVHSMVAAESMESSDCILCGNCTAVCRKKAIRFSFSRPGRHK